VIGDPRWGRELEDAPGGTEASLTDVAEAVSAGRWNDALAGMAGRADVDLLDAANLRELAGVVRLLAQGDPLSALVRLTFSLVEDPDTGLVDAIAGAVAKELQRADLGRWAMLAWVQHSAGEAEIEKLPGSDSREGEDPWKEARTELEDRVFELADATSDPCWQATSALVASREIERSVDDDTILQFARIAVQRQPDNARAQALLVRVLLNLEHEDDARRRFADAVDAHAADTAWLLEFLRAASVETDLPRLCQAAYSTAVRSRPDDADLARAVAEHLRRRQPDDTAGDPDMSFQNMLHAGPSGDSAGIEATRAALDVVLPGAPRRTDEEWLATKQTGDRAFKNWMIGAGFVLLLVYALVRMLLD
jgi:hypothetical protein